jgi:hypothetical protein
MPFRPGLIVTIFFILFTFSCKEAVNDFNTLPQAPPTDTTTGSGAGTTFMYGSPSDSFDLVNGLVKRNECCQQSSSDTGSAWRK